MAISVNSNPDSVKAYGNMSRDGRFLSLAVNGLSSVARVDDAGEHPNGLSPGEKRAYKTHHKNDLEPTRLVDQIFASPSGWARRDLLDGMFRTSQKMDSENEEKALHQTRLQILETPWIALDMQARLSPSAVMKLLE